MKNAQTIRGSQQVQKPQQQGTSLLELTVVVAVIMILSTMAMPLVVNAMRTFRIAGDARSIAGELSLARLRAANDFTRTRLHLNTTAGGAFDGTFQVELWDAVGGQFVAEGGTQSLAPGDSFTVGTLSSAPPNTQSTLAETGDIVFNSRGVAVDPATLSPIDGDVIYIGNSSQQYYAISVGSGSRIVTWQYDGANWNQI